MVSPVTNYKKIETSIVEKMGQFFLFIGNSIVSFFRFVIQKGKQRFTVMFIPHSEKKIVNFHISIFSLVFLGVLLVVLIIGFFVLSTYFAGSRAKYTEVSMDLEKSKSSIDKFEDEIKRLIRSSESLKENMGALIKVFGKQRPDVQVYRGLGGDLSTMSENYDFERDSAQLTEIRELMSYLDSIQEPISEITQFIQRQMALLVDTPNLWPVAGRIGNITAYFGPEEHPFKKNFRLHTGVDIAWGRGTPIIATANGTVENIGYQPTGLGLNVTLRHKYGFKTVYGHMNKTIVERGQYVERGQVIGYMGSTGLSTGPHVHYEVWIGEQLVDPMYYLDMNTELEEKIK